MYKFSRSLLWLPLVAGCTLANLTPSARFAESTNVLNDSTRWGKVDTATSQVSSKYLSKFVARHKEWGGGISIADFDILQMSVTDDHKEAVSEVALSWYMTGGVMLHQSTITQHWEADHGRFRLVDEVVRAGDPRVFESDTEEPDAEAKPSKSDPS